MAKKKDIPGQITEKELALLPEKLRNQINAQIAAQVEEESKIKSKEQLGGEISASLKAGNISAANLQKISGPNIGEVEGSKKKANSIEDNSKKSADNSAKLVSLTQQLVKNSEKNHEDMMELLGRMLEANEAFKTQLEESKRGHNEIKGKEKEAGAGGGTDKEKQGGGFWDFLKTGAEAYGASKAASKLMGSDRSKGKGKSGGAGKVGGGKNRFGSTGLGKMGSGLVKGGIGAGIGYGVYNLLDPSTQTTLQEYGIDEDVAGAAGGIIGGASDFIKGAFLTNPFTAVATGGGMLSYGAAKATQGEFGKQIYEGTKQGGDPLGGAMAGDYALAAAIMHGPKQSEEEKQKVEKEREQLKDAPWYTRLYGIGKEKYLSKDAEASDVGNLGSNQAPVNPNMLEPGVTPDVSGGFQVTGREEFDKNLVNKQAATPGVTPDISGVMVSAKEDKNEPSFVDKVKGFFGFGDNNKQVNQNQQPQVTPTTNEQAVNLNPDVAKYWMLNKPEILTKYEKLSNEDKKQVNTILATATSQQDAEKFIESRSTKLEIKPSDGNQIQQVVNNQNINEGNVENVNRSAGEIGNVESKKGLVKKADQISQQPEQQNQAAPIIVKGGDTYNNVTNNNSSGGNSGGAGSPSRTPNPFDKMVFGEPWAAYP